LQERWRAVNCWAFAPQDAELRLRWQMLLKLTVRAHDFAGG
jgi:hypothetical protein